MKNFILMFGNRAYITFTNTVATYIYAIIYRKNYNINRTKSQILNDYRLVLQLSFPNPLQQGVKSRMKM